MRIMKRVEQQRRAWAQLLCDQVDGRGLIRGRGIAVQNFEGGLNAKYGKLVGMLIGSGDHLSLVEHGFDGGDIIKSNDENRSGFSGSLHGGDGS
jgi:hypothetical protein